MIVYAATTAYLKGQDGYVERGERKKIKRGKIRKSAIPNHQIMIVALNE